ncbi:SLAM family member 6-like [Aquarana catesbeiana]|uniref:SLAM family member 6-like n=1 Tax=Aquarana catesbeiana TaxID=8400 RepID=UPI003CCA3ACE
MSPFYFWIVVLLNLQIYVMSEAPSVKEDVLGAVGGAVTLHLCYTGATSITWIFDKRGLAIARTKPGEKPEIKDSNYDGRLSSTPDGSLIITELRLEDQEIYKAQFRTDTGTKTCDYHLTVFSNLTAEDVTINSNVTDNKTCEVSLKCLVDSVDGRNMTIIWRSLNSSNVNQTQNIVFVPPSNINFTYICTAKNPVSNVSKNVVPWLYCNNGKYTYAPYTRSDFLMENV